MKINLTSELSKLVTDDLIQFAKSGKKLVAKTKRMEVGGGLPIRRNENNKSLPDKEKKPSGIGTDLGPSVTVDVLRKDTKFYWGEQGGRAASSRVGYAQSLENPNDTVSVPLSQVRSPKPYDKIIIKNKNAK